MGEELLHQSLRVSFRQIFSKEKIFCYKPVAHNCLAFIEILEILKISNFIILRPAASQSAHSGPVVEQLGPVVSVGGGAEDVHHHEVLDVVLLPPGLLQLVDIVPNRKL